MSFIDVQTKDDIRNAIRALEKETAGEMVCVITPASANYRVFAVLWAALVALASPALNDMLHMLPGMGDWGAVRITQAMQLGIFAGCLAVFALTPLRIRLTPKSVRANNAHNLCFKQFFANNLHQTQDRTGVLLFVSLAERHVEIMGDKGINRKIDPAEWREMIDEMVTAIRQNRVRDGYMACIEKVTARLKEHFPARDGDENELPNQVVELAAPDNLS